MDGFNSVKGMSDSDLTAGNSECFPWSLIMFSVVCVFSMRELDLETVAFLRCFHFFSWIVCRKRCKLHR